MWHSHFIIIEMLKTKLFKPNSVYFSNWIFSVTLTTRVEKPPKLERLQNKIPDIKFDFLLLDFIRNKCSRIQGTFRRTCTRTCTRTDQVNSWLVLVIWNSNIFKENLWWDNGQILIGKKLFAPVRIGCSVWYGPRTVQEFQFQVFRYYENCGQTNQCPQMVTLKSVILLIHPIVIRVVYRKLWACRVFTDKQTESTSKSLTTMSMNSIYSLEITWKVDRWPLTFYNLWLYINYIVYYMPEKQTYIWRIWSLVWYYI